jgi:hypothetical protein
MSEQIRVMIVDDHEVVREGLRALLNRRTNMTVVAEAHSVESSVAEAARAKPDVIVMDVRLGDGSGVEACREIRAEAPATRRSCSRPTPTRRRDRVDPGRRLRLPAEADAGWRWPMPSAPWRRILLIPRSRRMRGATAVGQRAPAR